MSQSQRDLVSRGASISNSLKSSPLLPRVIKKMENRKLNTYIFQYTYVKTFLNKKALDNAQTNWEMLPTALSNNGTCNKHLWTRTNAFLYSICPCYTTGVSWKVFPTSPQGINQFTSNQPPNEYSYDMIVGPRSDLCKRSVTLLHKTCLLLHCFRAETKLTVCKKDVKAILLYHFLKIHMF